MGALVAPQKRNLLILPVQTLAEASFHDINPKLDRAVSTQLAITFPSAASMFTTRTVNVHLAHPDVLGAHMRKVVNACASHMSPNMSTRLCLFNCHSDSYTAPTTMITFSTEVT